MLRDKCTLRKTYFLANDEYLPFEVEWAVARVFDQIAKNYREILKYSENLLSAVDFNLKDAFNTLDLRHKGFLTYKDLDYFMESNNVNISENELNSLFNAINKKGDGKINYTEFVDVILHTKSSNSEYTKARNNYKRKKEKRAQTADKSTMQKTNKNPKFFDNNYINYSTNKQLKTTKSKNNNEFLSTKKKPNFKRNSDIKSSNKKIAFEYITPVKNNKNNKETLQNSSRSKFLSPEKYSEEKFLIRMFKEQIEMDREIDLLRKELAPCYDFNLLDGFRFFDKYGNAFLTPKNFKNVLENDLLLETSMENIALLFQKFDKNKEGLLRYSDFCRIVLPLFGNERKMLEEKSPSFNQNDNFFSMKTKKIFKNLLKTLLDCELQAEILRQQLNKRPNFCLSEIFMELDKNENGFLETREFEHFLNNYSFSFNAKDIFSLINRYDKNQDGKVSYSEFIQEMTPKSPIKLI